MHNNLQILILQIICKMHNNYANTRQGKSGETNCGVIHTVAYYSGIKRKEGRLTFEPLGAGAPPSVPPC